MLVVRTLSSCMLVVSVAAWAQVRGPDLRDVMQARNHAMGGAFEAMGYGTEVISGNPAALSLYKRYQIEASGSWDPPNGYGLGSIAIADSTNPLAAGLTYQFVTFGAEERRWAHLTSLALAYAVADFIHLGLATRHQVLVGASNTNSVTMNAGIVVRPVQFLTLGFSGHNLIGVYNADVPRYFVASAAAMLFDQLSPAFDVWMDFNQPAPRFSYRGGVEWLVAKSFPIRAGYQFDDIVQRQYLSGGIGWFVDGSGIDFSYRQELGGGEGRLFSLTVKLQF